VVDAQVPADADQPRLKIRTPVERVERLEDLQEDFLREILGFLVPADELVRDVEDLPPVHANDGVPGGLIALQAPFDERLDRLRRIGRHVGRHQGCRTRQDDDIR
jgi:hypothetical protein